VHELLPDDVEGQQAAGHEGNPRLVLEHVIEQAALQADDTGLSRPYPDT
jgi:hypothetical protein